MNDNQKRISLTRNPLNNLSLDDKARKSNERLF